ncbi:hypothetical protein MYOV056v2_p0199 [Vibrio phage 184E37.3a]|nr:hypothetical protein MYOV056v2_p0199 [Vibrio phage 184E37.3a]
MDTPSGGYYQLLRDWRGVVMDTWVYYDKPWFNPLVGKVVVAYKESFPDKKTRMLKLEYLCQGEIRNIEVEGKLVFGEEG